jgi:SAM-dependent methyltransferase
MLYDHPELYDAMFGAEEHAAHYSALAAERPGAVLELACGTAQLTVPLAQAGRIVVGLDSSPAMLAAARRRVTAAGAAVDLVEADMRAFDLGRRFALVFIARNSLLHLGTAEDFAATFAAVRRHLAPGGVFAFDVFNPDVHILAQPAGQRRRLMRVQSETHGELTVDATSDYDAATQVNRATWYVSRTDRPDAWVMPLHLRSIFPQELPLLLAANDLRLVSRTGDLWGSPFTSASSRQVCVCVDAHQA